MLSQQQQYGGAGVLSQQQQYGGAGVPIQQQQQQPVTPPP